MRKLICLALFLSLVIFATAQRPGASIDMTHYEFSLSLTDVNNNIEGNAVVEFVVLKETNSVTLDLISKRADGKGMSVLAVKEKDNSLRFNHANDILTIQLSSPAKPGDQKTLVIQYTGIPVDGLIITNNKYKHRGFFADNWPNRARNWIPCVDHPADKAAVDFRIKAPSHYQVVANGIQVEETSVDSATKLTHYKETVPLATKIMTIGVAGFAVQLAGEVSHIPVYSWVYPEDRNKGFYDYAPAVEILGWFIKNWGPYAYKKLANVQSKTIFGGLENANTIFYSENSVTGTRKNEGLLTHEIAHQWFGNMATETDWPHLWLSEGFATYMTILYFENKYGRDTARYMLAEDRAQVIAFTKTKMRPVVDTTVTDYMQLLNANSYQKGGWVLHMLRQQLGDSAFHRGIRTYYARYAGKNASTDDLRKVLEEISKKDLKQFFKQWLYTAGHPVLEVSWKYDEGKKMIAVTITQKQGQVFQFPLEISLNTGAKKQNKTVQVRDRETTINIASTIAPQQVTLDPETKLLFEGNIKN
jgi:aminopeptidase N